MPKIKVKGQMVQTGECPQTDGHTDTNKRIISPAMQSIIKLAFYSVFYVNFV